MASVNQPEVASQASGATPLRCAVHNVSVAGAGAVAITSGVSTQSRHLLYQL